MDGLTSGHLAGRFHGSGSEFHAPSGRRCGTPRPRQVGRVGLWCPSCMGLGCILAGLQKRPGYVTMFGSLSRISDNGMWRGFF
jgi:hypothetical protein